VFVDAALKIAGHTDVENGMILVRDDIDVVVAGVAHGRQE
jgi:hypothetical protein